MVTGPHHDFDFSEQRTKIFVRNARRPESYNTPEKTIADVKTTNTRSIYYAYFFPSELPIDFMLMFGKKEKKTHFWT